MFQLLFELDRCLNVVFYKPIIVPYRYMLHNMLYKLNINKMTKKVYFVTTYFCINTELNVDKCIKTKRKSTLISSIHNTNLKY